MTETKDAKEVERDLRQLIVGEIITNIEMVAGDENELNRIEITCGDRMIIMFAAMNDDMIVAAALCKKRADVHSPIFQTQ